MKPYYERDGVQIFHGDCRDVLPLLPSDCADLIVTDPPYGVKWRSNGRQEKFDAIVGDDSRESAEIAVPLALRLLRNHRHSYIFGRFNFQGLPISEIAELIWDKGSFNAGDLKKTWAQQHEYIQFFTCRKRDGIAPSGMLPVRMRKGTILRYPRLNATQVQLHPTEKPTMLLRDLVESSSQFHEVVLDFFAGSGSTLVAARQECRRAIGIEIEERYCEIAAKRLSQDVFEFPTEHGTDTAASGVNESASTTETV